MEEQPVAEAPDAPDAPDAAEGAAQVPVVVDEADMMAIPTDPDQNLGGEEAVQPGSDAAEQQNIALDGAKSALPGEGVTLPARPPLKREKSVPAPQRLPPPAPPAPAFEASHQPTDSLSLMQLKKLVTDMPKAEPTPYAFEYEDAASFAAEVEEWFSYSVEEQAMLLKAQSSFVEEWVALEDGTLSNLAAYEQGEMDWCKAEAPRREELVRKLLDTIQQPDKDSRLRSMEALLNIALGCWHETAGLASQTGEAAERESASPTDSAGANSNYVKSELQIEWIRRNIQMIFECDGVQPIFDVMRAASLREFATDVVEQEIAPQEDRDADKQELWCSLTLMYMFHEAARTDLQWTALRQKLSQLNPNIVVFLIEIITSLRWDDSIGPPLQKILLLTWKAILVAFGGLEEVDDVKASLDDPMEETLDNRGQPIITASPLDYHLFRQEISSKYPAYNPPPPLFPLEPENNSILPPLKNQPKPGETNAFGPSMANVNSNGTSILNQPVHIATPAPSPPPSPAGPGGKGGKKQNYQTNQLFPFLYPPLDESSNNLGGKGSTDLQDVLVGRKWKGSDIPTSIQEAAELFSKRMRATRAMKQLWEERVLFMKYERGWLGSEDRDVDLLDLSSKLEKQQDQKDQADDQKKEDTPEARVAAKLQKVEDFYRVILPHLQSLVIVLLRTFLSHLATLALQNNAPTSAFPDTQNGTQAGRPEGNGIAGSMPDVSKVPVEELDRTRTEEIQDKAASGILILLLKWFKVSHILKFEYLTQLLVDSNYIPLTLKLLQLQEIEKAINYKCDRDDLNFFSFCRTHSREGNDEESANENPVEDEEVDEAAPPPIKRRPSSDHLPEAPEPPTSALPAPPEVDELGIPLSDLPTAPITSFSWRNFFTNINLLRIMQKLCKNKAHRNLMLVQYKSSQYLRKSLRIPQPQLRLYTLKLFKNQVPYCGRKWRQSNMRVITAVYLHCRPELRDDWLAGSDVDADVDESVPLEQALRALTHWFNLKHYPERLGADKGALDRDRDFFRMELEKMGWGEDFAAGAGMVEEGEWEGQNVGVGNVPGMMGEQWQGY